MKKKIIVLIGVIIVCSLCCLFPLFILPIIPTTDGIHPEEIIYYEQNSIVVSRLSTGKIVYLKYGKQNKQQIKKDWDVKIDWRPQDYLDAQLLFSQEGKRIELFSKDCDVVLKDTTYIYKRSYDKRAYIDIMNNILYKKDTCLPLRSLYMYIKNEDKINKNGCSTVKVSFVP